MRWTVWLSQIFLLYFLLWLVVLTRMDKISNGNNSTFFSHLFCSLQCWPPSRWPPRSPSPASVRCPPTSFASVRTTSWAAVPSPRRWCSPPRWKVRNWNFGKKESKRKCKQTKIELENDKQQQNKQRQKRDWNRQCRWGSVHCLNRSTRALFYFQREKEPSRLIE